MKSMDLPESPLPSYATYFVEATVVGSNDRSSMQLSQLVRRRHAPTLRDLDELATDLGDRRTAREPNREIEVGAEVLDHLAHA